MKLKNKKTGEIGKILKQLSEDNQIEVITDDKLYVVKSLAALNEEWEDYYEEPKTVYFIGDTGDIIPVDSKTMSSTMVLKDRLIDFGNYFETKEEAEKAVEKLKAFANLRKRGFKFNGWTDADRGIVGEFEIYCDALELDGIEQELEAVFGREEV